MWWWQWLWWWDGDDKAVILLNVRSCPTIKCNQGSTFWEIAKEVKSKLPSNKMDTVHDLIQYHHNLTAKGVEEVYGDKTVDLTTNNGRNNMMIISNLGNTEAMIKSQYGRFQLHSFHFGYSNFMWGCCVFVLLYSFKGQLHFSYSYPSPAYEDCTIRELASKVMNSLDEVISVTEH